MRGFININYDEGDAMTYESVTLKTPNFGPEKLEDTVHTFATGNPVADYLACCRKCIELIQSGELEGVSMSSDVDHFVMDSDFLEWKVWPDGSERFVFKDEFGWGWTSYRKTGFRVLNENTQEYDREYKVKFQRILSPQQQKRSALISTTVYFTSKTPVQTIRWMVQQLQEGRVGKPQDFEGKAITIRKGVQVE